MRVAQITRRSLLGAAAATAIISPRPRAQAATRYKRYLITSPGGIKALASYTKGVEAMLKLPPDHPHNWFRNAFVHLMDCPHGNWWFYVWHRGYLGYFEQTIRALSGDQDFALPYWDWTQLPQVPDAMFTGVLTPTDDAFKPYTASLDVFTPYFKPSLEKIWSGLSTAQRRQLDTRGYKSIDDLWNDVTGNGVPGNESFAVTTGARYLSKGNPKLDADTANAVSAQTVLAGLLAPRFYDPKGSLSFTSSKTASHNSAPGNATVFSVLEGLPHNLVHNCIGGVGAIDPGPYGNMTNFLSPVDPIFFLHHSNMDRLWDVWTRKQMALKEPFLPEGQDRKTLSDEPFLFFTDASGHPVKDGKAGSYLSTSRFDYSYDGAGYGENLVGSAPAKPVAEAAPAARVAGNAASVTVPNAAIQSLAANARNQKTLVAQVTLERPTGPGARQFRVFVGAPADATNLGPDSPYYAGTVGFFGPQMAGMAMQHDATFTLPFATKLPAFAARTETQALGAAPAVEVPVRVTAVSGGNEATPVLKGFSIGVL